MTLRDVDAVRTTPTKTTHRTEQGLTQSTERTDSTGTYSTNYVAGVELTVANRAGNTASDHDATSHLHLVSTYPQGATADDEDLEDRKLFSWLFLGNQALERTQDVKTVEKGVPAHGLEQHFGLGWCRFDVRMHPPTLPPELSADLPPTVLVYIRCLEARVAQLEARVAELEAKLNRNSTNSSKPPSTDPPDVKRAPPQPKSGKKARGRMTPTAIQRYRTTSVNRSMENRLFGESRSNRRLLSAISETNTETA